MAFAHYPLAVSVETLSKPTFKPSILLSSPLLSSSSSSSSSSATTTTTTSGSSLFSLSSSSTNSSIKWKVPKLPRIGHRANVNPQDSEATSAADAFFEFKHLLLPITDRNPYLSEGTRQAASTTAALAKKYGADITVVVIDERLKDSRPEHDTQLASIRWHLSEGGFQEFKLLERLGEGKPTAIIGEVADEMSLDLVVMSMEAIHSKHVDANLLAEFVPCPVILLPL